VLAGQKNTIIQYNANGGYLELYQMLYRKPMSQCDVYSVNCFLYGALRGALHYRKIVDIKNYFY
jgi:hypothetical protein